MNDTRSGAGLSEALVALARRAGAAILPHYEPAVAADTKADGSPVTAADHAAEAVIVEELRGLTPDIPVIAEEEVARGGTPPVPAGRFWLVDPLDGTKEFLAHNGEFTVNIALVEAGRPVLGVVYAPALGVTYWTDGAGGAIMEEPGAAPRAIAVRAVPADGVVVAASRSHRNKAELERFLAGLTVARQVIAGSSIKFCLIARGEADLYPRFGTTMEWDTAAGHAVLAAAGGRVETIDGDELAYGKPDFRNPHFIARGH
jgi:3'(2'), 5'-bisphosphate nucleotidase